MASSYLGNLPSNNFVSLKRQVITGNGGSSYTLDHSVASVNDVAIFVNNVRQDPATYSISGTALTLGGTISSSDSCYVIFLGQALQTVTPATGTVTNAMLGETITVAKGGTGLTSGFKNGITMTDSWRLTADTNSGTNAVISTNWEQVDESRSAEIGTALSESSGVFTLPQTGVYLIIFNMQYNILSDASAEVALEFTENNSSFTEVAEINSGNQSASGINSNHTNTFMFGITDTTNQKFRFSTLGFGANTLVRGDTSDTESGFSIIRLGDN